MYCVEERVKPDRVPVRGVVRWSGEGGKEEGRGGTGREVNLNRRRSAEGIGGRKRDGNARFEGRREGANGGGWRTGRKGGGSMSILVV